MPAEQRPTEIIKWLTAGPVAVARGTRWTPLPEGTTLIGNVPAVSNDKLQINLSGQARAAADDPAALDRLATPAHVVAAAQPAAARWS